MKVCKQCNGKGRLENESIRLSHFSRRIVSWITCYVCKGKGRVTK